MINYTYYKDAFIMRQCCICGIESDFFIKVEGAHIREHVCIMCVEKLTIARLEGKADRQDPDSD